MTILTAVLSFTFNAPVCIVAGGGELVEPLIEAIENCSRKFVAFF
jgi:hypothetical protein